MRVVDSAVEKVDKVKDATTDALHKQTPKKRYRDEEALLEGWLYRETSVQGAVRRATSVQLLLLLLTSDLCVVLASTKQTDAQVLVST